MIDAELYLSSLANRSGNPKPSAHLLNPESDLPIEVLQAAQRGWSVVPLRLQSHGLPIRKSVVGYPTSDLVQLRHWTYPDAQWVVQTGPGSILIVELDSRVGRDSLQRLYDEDWGCEWPATLQYRSGRVHFAVFRHPGGSIRRLGSEFPGIKIRSHDLVLIPPSSIAGSKLEYVDPDISILPAPTSLLAAEGVDSSTEPQHEVPHDIQTSTVRRGTSAA